MKDGSMTRTRLTMAATDYDRLRALQDGRVVPEGIDLNMLSMPVEEIFFRQLKHLEFEVSELSLSSYVLTLDREDPPFWAIPVFPSRYFRHQTIFVNRTSGIRSPADLVGKRIGVPEYQITAAVWQRGMLHDDYGVRVQDVRFFTGGVESPGRHEKVGFPPPPGVSIEPIGPDQTLSDMLAAGELDAVISASVPPSFDTSDDVVRLFPNYKEVEQDYYRRTGIFPIMHVIVIRRDVLAEEPWIARSLMKAFDEALEVAKADLRYRSSLKVMLPWLVDHVEETRAIMGEDYFDYGIEKNRGVLEAFLRYHHDQGLSKSLRTPEEIFAPSAQGSYVI
jgi:4,5-dihydroxyphthalate decarboxylase